MTYEEFKMTICRQLKDLLPSGTVMRLQKIRKNNGLELDGLIITGSQSNLSPTIFLDYYYEKRNSFPDFDAVCKDILRTYERNKPTEPINIDFFTDYEQIKHQLAYRIINFEQNKKLLQTIPHIRYLDLAIVFYCLLSFSDQGNATILIHANHQKAWNISTEALYTHTCRTTPMLLPYDFRNMGAVLSETFHEYHPSDESCPMFVLTNARKLYGAGCILYPHLLEHISEEFHSDLFILPSSIHEVILLPYSDRVQPDELAALVASINQTELSVDEVLSDHVYYYSRSEHALHICLSKT